ncbi:rhomboid family protease [Schizosaccharomyces cryophilus OY26]|uniref:rhomboid protease n=1 Tax=Schizosaccharomyces cryophilus (strain OY26 / ATCC MYA-4695 / CBS 11777 / NBRC 106824 / NRRL Y48691) TaxID=653667 RepID=S9XBJ3_SCHCR|nr:rhomboid family protease [Schizosaccharomyces cryophilus OY26]EPY51161.1 rhomboid family protease [Schizosaccharomyces cryophilus OY26]
MIIKVLERFRDFVQNLPLWTKTVTWTALFIQLVSFMGLRTSKLALSWSNVFQKHLVFEVYTYVFLHISLLHIIFNLVSLLPVMAKFEKEHGTFACVFITMLPYTLFPAFMHLIFYRFIFAKESISIAGFSGWAFAFISATCIHNPQGPIQNYIPKHWIPLIYLFITTIFVPYASFIGHASGAAAGYATPYIFEHIPLKLWAEKVDSIGSRFKGYQSYDELAYASLPIAEPSTGNPKFPGTGTRLGT